jgi:hypothetical protein
MGGRGKSLFLGFGVGGREGQGWPSPGELPLDLLRPRDPSSPHPPSQSTWGEGKLAAQEDEQEVPRQLASRVIRKMLRAFFADQIQGEIKTTGGPMVCGNPAWQFG